MRIKQGLNYYKLNLVNKLFFDKVNTFRKSNILTILIATNINYYGE